MEFSHIPVLFSQCMEGLRIDPAGTYIDGTAGGGGHSAGIARQLTTGRLIALDKDPDAVAAAGERLGGPPAPGGQRDIAALPPGVAPRASARWTGSCWTWGCPPTSWIPRSGGSPIWRTPPWICG